MSYSKRMCEKCSLYHPYRSLQRFLFLMYRSILTVLVLYKEQNEAAGGDGVLRKDRLTARQKKKVAFSIFVKTFILIYLLCFSLASITQPTTASFNAVVTIEHSTNAGEWDDGKDDVKEEWRGSSLTFLQGEQKGSCEELSVTIKNAGDGDMKKSVTYVLYFDPNLKGKPTFTDETILYEGTIDPLKAGETLELTYEPTEPGRYKFKVYQEEGHPEEGEVWQDGDAFVLKGCKQPEEKIDEAERSSMEEDKETFEEDTILEEDESSDFPSPKNEEKEHSDIEEQEGRTKQNHLETGGEQGADEDTENH